MRFAFIASIAVLLPLAPAIAQENQRPSSVAVITALHQELNQMSDQLTLSQAQLYDADQQIAQLQATISALRQKVEVDSKTKQSSGSTHQCMEVFSLTLSMKQILYRGG